jgi:hypothetical protein
MLAGARDSPAVARLLTKAVLAFAAGELLLGGLGGAVAVVSPYTAALGYLFGTACLVLAGLAALVRRRARVRAVLTAIGLWVLPLLAAGGPTEVVRHLLPTVRLSTVPFAELGLFVLYCAGAWLAHAAREGPLHGVVLGFLTPPLLGAFVLNGAAAQDVLGSKEWRNRRIALRVGRVEWQQGTLRMAAVLDLAGGHPDDLRKITDIGARYVFSRAYYDDSRPGRLEWSGAPRSHEAWTPGTYALRMTFPDVGAGPERPDGKSEVHFWLSTPSEIAGMDTIWETRIAIPPPH